MEKRKKRFLILTAVLAALLAAALYLLTGEARSIGPLGHVNLERQCYAYDPATGEVGEQSTVRLVGWFCTWDLPLDNISGAGHYFGSLDVEVFPEFQADREIFTADVSGPLLQLDGRQWIHDHDPVTGGLITKDMVGVSCSLDRKSGGLYVYLMRPEAPNCLVAAPSPEEVPEVYKAIALWGWEES